MIPLIVATTGISVANEPISKPSLRAGSRFINEWGIVLQAAATNPEFPAQFS
jgi:hypothetical protein